MTFLLVPLTHCGKTWALSLSAVCIKIKLLFGFFYFFLCFSPFHSNDFHSNSPLSFYESIPVQAADKKWPMKKKNKTQACGLQRGEWRRAVQGCLFNALCCNWLHFRSTVPHLNLFLFVSSCRSVCTEGENVIHSSMLLSQGWLSSHFSESVLQAGRKALGIQFLSAFVTCIIENPFKQIYWAKSFLYLDSMPLLSCIVLK